MDYTFWADIYSRTGAVYPGLSRVVVFLLAGGLALLLWWGVAQRTYERQEAALNKTEAAERELARLSAAVTAIQSNPPVVNITMPPPKVEVISTPVAQPPVEQPEPNLAFEKNEVTKQDQQYTVRISIANTSSVPVQGDMAYALLSGPVGGAITESPIPVPTPWIFEKSRAIELTYSMTLTKEQEELLRTNKLTIQFRATADYQAGKQRMRYEFKGALRLGADHLNVMVNKKTPIA